MSCSAASVEMKARWEHFPHDADVGVRGFGASAGEAFEQAAMALTAVVTHAEVKPQVSVEVRCEAPDLELLFVEWLKSSTKWQSARCCSGALRFGSRAGGSKGRCGEPTPEN
jgi:hypothetical protein